MKTRKRLLRVSAVFLLLVTLFSTIATPAFAASTTSSRDCSGDKDGQTWKYIYVKTGSTTSSRQVALTMKKGAIYGRILGGTKTPEFDCYGSYEIKVCYWNGKNWVQEQQYDVYNKSGKTITMNKKNTYYRILVYSWNVNTVFKSYINKKVINQGLEGDHGDWYSNCCWSKIPKCTAKPKSGCTMYTSTPTSKA